MNRHAALIIDRDQRIPRGHTFDIGARFIQQEKQSMPWHSHRRMHELVIGLKHDFQHQINGRPFRQQQGEISWIRASDFHQLEGQNCAWVNIALDHEWAMHWCGLFPESSSRLQTSPHPIPARLWPGIEHQLTNWCQDHRNPDPTSMRRFLFECLSGCQPESDHQLPDWLHTALQEINQTPLQELNLAEIKRRCRRSHEHVARSFRQHLKCTPSGYLTQLRLQQARKQLQTTDQPILHIARNCGFRSMNYFFTCFRKTFHTSPAEYRKTQSCLT